MHESSRRILACLRCGGGRHEQQNKRLDAASVEVRITNDLSTGLRPTSLRITIKGQLWNQPVPLELLLSADVDVDTGQAAVRDLRA